MRIPHIIEFNAKEAFQPSSVSLKLLGEVERKLRPENFTWDEASVETLANLSLQVIAQNFRRNPVLKELTPLDRDHLHELISTDLDLDFVIPLIEDEYYWKRRYHDKFGTTVYKKHIGWTWKCLYLERHVRKMCEEAESQYNDEETFQPFLALCAPYIHTLAVTQLQHWKPPKTLLPCEWPEVHPTTHISFVPIFQNLPNLVEVEICYGMNEVGERFDSHMFKMSSEDCERLGEALLALKHLKVLRLHRSGVECAHVKALAQKLIHNSTLVELDLSHCKIGDVGARCVGMLLNIHEKLKIVNLRDNKIGEQGAMGLAWSLLNPEGTCLHRLDLSLNPLHHEGTMAILRALVRGPLPRELSLASCGVHGITALRIASMIAINTSLRSLDISGNEFGADAAEALLVSIEKNTRLLSLEMRNTGIPEEIKTKIKRFLKRNFDNYPPVSKSTLDFGFIENVTLMYDNTTFLSM